jgi:hypothetical protein
VLRNLGTGAAAVLAAGLLAVGGCGDDGDTIVIGSSGELNNNDQFNASSIASANLADDGGGLSPNSVSFANLRIVFSCDCCDSDGTFSGNNDALVLFTTTGGTPNVTRLHASHYDGSSLTPAVELKMEDRNEATGITPAEIVAVQLTTAAYANSGAATNADAIRQNAGNWVFVVPYTTFFEDPRLRQAENFGSALVGPRQTIASFVWLRGERANALSTSSSVGGVARTFRYGFQETGNEIVPAGFRAGGYTGGGATYPNTTIPVAPTASPANNVLSVGMISDALCGQTFFGHTALPASDAAVSNVTTAAATNYVRAHPNQNNASRLPAIYHPGEDMTMLVLFYTQINNSNAGGGTSTTANNSSAGGAQIDAYEASFNLETQAWETPTEVAPPSERPGNAENTNLRAGTSFYPTFAGYNQFVVYKYFDASLINPLSSGTGLTSFTDPLRLVTQNAGNNDTFSYDNTGSHEGGTLSAAGFHEDILALRRYVDDGDGTASPSTGTSTPTNFDLSLHDTGTNTHDTTNPTSSGGTTPFGAVINLAPNREIQNLNHAVGDANDGDLGRGGQFIFGADEGLADLVIFFTTSDNTRTGGGDVDDNIDRALACAVYEPTTNTLTEGLISRHEEDHQTAFLEGRQGVTTQTTSDGGEHDLQDPLLAFGSRTNGQAGSGRNVAGQGGPGVSAWFFDACINRTGEYVNIAYIQDMGLSLSFTQSLNVITYQTFRSQSGTTGGTATPPAFATRFAGPTRINPAAVGADDLASGLVQPATTAANDGTQGGLFNFAETFSSWTSIPVNSAAWQGCLGYRCGFQSDKDIMFVLYEQSDATEDRLFTARITVTLGATGSPTHASSGAIEIEDTANVSGHVNYDNFNDPGSFFAGGTRSTFRFIDGDLPSVFGVLSADIGANAAGAGGGLLIVYQRIIDATTADNDLGDSGVFGVSIDPGSTTVTGRVLLSTSVVMNRTIPGPNNNQPNDPFDSTNANVAGGFNPGPGTAGLVCVPNNTDIVQSPDYSGDAIYIYMLDHRAQNGNDPLGLFTRDLDLVDRRTATTANTTLALQLTPNAGADASTAGYAEPTRLDHLGASSVSQVQTATSGVAVLVLFEQEGHIWAQASADGETYLTSGGAPAPVLVDNDTSENVGFWNLFDCEDASGDFRDGILAFEKDDADNDARLRARTSPRVQ